MTMAAHMLLHSPISAMLIRLGSSRFFSPFHKIPVRCSIKVGRSEDATVDKVRANFFHRTFTLHAEFIFERHVEVMHSGPFASFPRVLTLGTTGPPYRDRCTRAPVGKKRSSAPGGFGRPSAPMSASRTGKT